MSESKNEYPMSEDEYVETVQKLFKEKYSSWSEDELNMLYDERVINLIKEGYETDCWAYDTGSVPKDYFDVDNNDTFAGVCLSDVAMAIQYPEFALND